MKPQQHRPMRSGALAAASLLLLITLACGQTAATTPTKAPVAKSTVAQGTPTERVIPTLVATYTRMATYTPSLTPTQTFTRTPTPTTTRTPTRTLTPTRTNTVPLPTAVPPPVLPSAAVSTPPPATGLRPPAPTAEPDCPPPEQRTDLRGKIIFFTDRDSSSSYATIRVYVMDADGSNQVPLGPTLRCAQKTYDYYQDRMSVSNDRQWYLTVERAGSGTSVFLRDNQGRMVRRVTTLDGNNYDPAWAPNQAELTFVSQVDLNDEIYISDVKGTWTKRITFNTWEWDKHPTWSPEGKEIAFWSNRDSGRKQIWVAKVDGSGSRNNSHNGHNDWDPIWVNP